MTHPSPHPTDPDPARPVTVRTADGTRLSVLEWAPDGPPVLLLHAWGLSSLMWQAQVGALLAAGYRPITVDRRGHGRSDLPPTGYDAGTLIQDLLTVLDTLRLDDLVVVGHSTGGMEAVRLAAAAGGRVRAVVLGAPTTPCLTAGPDNADGLPPEAHAANRAAMARDLGHWIQEFTPGYWAAEEPAGGPWSVATTWTQQAIFSVPLPVLLATAETTATSDVRELLPTLDRPVLVIHGDADRSTPWQITGRPTSALLPQARVAIIPGAGHGSYTSFAGEYNRHLLDFLGRR